MARQETLCHGVPDSVVRWLKNGSKWLRAADLRERQKRRKVLKKELLVMVDAKRVPADVLPLVLCYVGFFQPRRNLPEILPLIICRVDRRSSRHSHVAAAASPRPASSERSAGRGVATSRPRRRRDLASSERSAGRGVFASRPRRRPTSSERSAGRGVSASRPRRRPASSETPATRKPRRYDHVGDDATPDSRHALLKQWVEAQIPPPAFANLEPWKRDALLRWIF